MANSHSDVVAITQLVNLYGLAVDSQWWQLFDSIFTTDIDADYGPCRITWWGGNPSINDGIPGVKFDLTTTALRQEADAGRVGVLAARARSDK